KDLSDLMNDKKTHMSKKELEKLAARLDKEMKAAAKELEFEEAARLRDLLVIVKGKLGDG
ncbi:MAG: UvrB/UvrC motif-containing protein, partial [Clostridiales bacterium]|nr:UvrB/UvrC motif-containing protein [Clostridiales bacterium]